MSTSWVINGMGGVVYSGIPSRDVAIVMAIDFERYEHNWDYDDEPLIRYEVAVDPNYSEGGAPFLWVGATNSRGLGLHEVQRCDACHQRVRSSR